MIPYEKKKIPVLEMYSRKRRRERRKGAERRRKEEGKDEDAKE